MLFTQQKIIQYFLIFLIGFFFGALIGYVLLLDFYEGHFLITIGLSGCYGVITLKSVNFINSIIDKKIPIGSAVVARFFFGFLINFLVAYLIFIIGLIVYKNLSINSVFFDIENQVTAKLAIVLLFLMMMYTFGYLAIQSYTYQTASRLKLIELENQQTHLKLDTLKSQLTPHFLFNNLNTISSLIDKDKREAELFIRHLANLYESILNLSSNNLILLKEEIEIVKSFTFLLESRFQDRFTCHINISEDKLRYKIAPLTIQLLVENALKHNELKNETPLEIRISTDESNIIVSNNINTKKAQKQSLKIGLQNIKERYKLLGDKFVSITKNKDFTVEIPLIS